MAFGRRGWLQFCGLLLVTAGCSSGSPARQEQPAIDPVAAGKAALAEYDTDRDGVISSAELDKCPPLKSALGRYDTGGDKKITAENIAARVEKWKQAMSSSTKLGIIATLDGAPLAGCNVTAEPEPFLGPEFKPATGVTDNYGSLATLVSSGKSGASFGLYKLRFSKVVGGKETIPARYNTQTELGVEVARDNPELQGGGLTFNLKSK